MSKVLANHSPSQLNRAFVTKLKIPMRSGKHRSGWYQHEGRKLFRVSLPSGNKDSWSPKVRKVLWKATRLSIEDYDDFVRCHISGPQYSQMVPALFPSSEDRPSG